MSCHTSVSLPSALVASHVYIIEPEAQLTGTLSTLSVLITVSFLYKTWAGNDYIDSTMYMELSSQSATCGQIDGQLEFFVSSYDNIKDKSKG